MPGLSRYLLLGDLSEDARIFMNEIEGRHLQNVAVGVNCLCHQPLAELQDHLVETDAASTTSVHVYSANPARATVDAGQLDCEETRSFLQLPAILRRWFGLRWADEGNAPDAQHGADMALPQAEVVALLRAMLDGEEGVVLEQRAPFERFAAPLWAIARGQTGADGAVVVLHNHGRRLFAAYNATEDAAAHFGGSDGESMAVACFELQQETYTNVFGASIVCPTEDEVESIALAEGAALAENFARRRLLNEGDLRMGGKGVSGSGDGQLRDMRQFPAEDEGAASQPDLPVRRAWRSRRYSHRC